MRSNWLDWPKDLHRLAVTATRNQEIWISQWGGDFYNGRGVPGESETPE
jgi:hypothetical protein